MDSAVELPYGSPLPPIMFLFSNPHLIQHQIDSQRGAIALVDDFTALAAGPTAPGNRKGTEPIYKEALDWERRNGV